ncbi:MAG TPA: FimV/HubP family polar landmark protein [Steroidobacteraceae bacterium]|nr:FimV/HubP family polar landmark protein [Steroidobacteraceae bacterium]
MVAKRASRAVALLLAVPSAAFALGLGDIRLLSPLDQPLKAQIELLDATPDALQNLQVQLASQDTFARYGLSWPQFLSSVHVKAVQTADGREVIELSSDQPVTDPVLTVLVEANWDRGHLIREYTVLLDPPVYVPNQSQAASQQVAPATTGTAPREGEIARSQAPAAPPPPAEGAPTPGSDQTAAGNGAASTAATASGGEPHSLVVRRGQTLSGIANQMSGAGVDSGPTRSWMVAIYQQNPSAFDHNMNLLRSGAVLRIPDNDTVAGISAAAATAEIHRQYAAWRTDRQTAGSAESGPGRLRLVAPAGGAGAGESPSASGASSGDVKALQAQVQTLQSQVADDHRQLQLKDAQLAQLQAQLAGKQAPQTPAAAAPAAGTPPPAANPNSTTAAAPASASPTPEQAPQPPPPVAANPPPSQAAPKPVPHVAHHAPAKSAGFKPGSPSLSDTLARYWWVIALAAVGLIGFVAARIVRSRRQSALDDSLGRLAAAGGSPYTRLEPSAGDTASIRPAPGAHDDDAFVVEESGTHERPKIAAAAAPVAAKHVTTNADTISTETAVNLDQGDPLAEADFHMAYGLYDQAADLIRIAIGREPERRDLKLKLLEVFFVWGNKEQFLQTARELAGTRAEAAPGEWEKIVIMGKQLAPEDPLFAGGAAVSGAAASGVDLDLAGGQGAGLDFDVAATGSHAQGLDLDIGSALGEGEEGENVATVEQPGTATDRNMALLDAPADASTGTTREMTATLPGGDELPGTYGTELMEGPTIEQPALHTQEQPTIRQKVETAMKQSGAEQTAELAIDDLGLDLGAFDTPEPAEPTESSPEAPTLVAGLDEHSRRIMEQANQGATEEVPEPTGTTNAWQIDESELEAVLTDADGRTNGHDTAATSRLAALKDAPSVDYELSDADAEPDHTNGSGIDLDVGTATVPDAAFTATQKLSAEDLALPDLEPVTMSEVGTKLDLARAYMDMGDPEGARNILEEVMHEGSVAQRQEAERLMESLPG